MAEEVKLLGITGSPFSFRVEVALKMKGIAYEFIEEEDVYGKKSELLLTSNPVFKKIPVFFHDGKTISESLVIVEYIDEKFKENPILPSDPYEKALARFWVKFVDDKCMATIWKVFMSEGEEQSKAMEEAGELLKILENELKGKKFFGGEQMGLVDFCTSFYVGFWVELMQEVSGIDLLTKDKFPNLTESIKEFLNHEVIQESLPPRDHMLRFFRRVLGTDYP